MNKIMITAAAVAAITVTIMSACGVSSKSFHHSTVSDNVLTSTYLGITAAFDDNWNFISEEELISTNNVEEWSDSALTVLLETAGTLTDTYATEETTGSSVVISYENLNLSGSGSLSEEGYIDASLDSTKKALEENGLVDVSAEKSTVSFAGTERHCLNIQGSVSDITVYEKIIVIKKAHYMGLITIGSPSPTEVDEITGCFTAIAAQ